MPAEFDPDNAYEHRGITVWARNTKRRQYVILSAKVDVDANIVEIEYDGVLPGGLHPYGCFNVLWQADDSIGSGSPLRATFSCPRVSDQGLVDRDGPKQEVAKMLTSELKTHSTGDHKFKFPKVADENGDLITATLKFASETGRPLATFLLRFKKPVAESYKRKQLASAPDEDVIVVQKKPRTSPVSGARIIEAPHRGQSASDATTRALAPERNACPTVEELRKETLREAEIFQGQTEHLKGNLKLLKQKNQAITLVNSRVDLLLK